MSSGLLFYQRPSMQLELLCSSSGALACMHILVLKFWHKSEPLEYICCCEPA